MSNMNTNYLDFPTPSRRQVAEFLEDLGVTPGRRDRRVRELAAKFTVMGTSGHRPETMLQAMTYEAYESFGQLPKGNVVKFSTNSAWRKGERATVHDAHVVLQVGDQKVSKPGESSVSTTQAFANATAAALQQLYPQVKPVVVSRSVFSVVRDGCGLAEVTLKSGATMAQLGNDEQQAVVSALFKATMMQARETTPAPMRKRECLLAPRQLLERHFVEGPQFAAM